MQRLRHGLIRIVKGPTGGFLASLGIAAFLGGVALATPAPPVADVTGHPGDVIAAAPLGSYPTSDGAVVSGDPTVTGGVQTDADPTGRGPALDPTAGGPNTSNGGLGPGDGSSGGVRSAGLAPAHQDARDDPTSGGSTREGHGHQGSGSGQGSGGNGYQGSGSGSSDGHGSGSGQGSGGHQRHKGTGSGSGGSGSGGSGSGGNGSGNRGDGGGSDSGGRGAGGSGSGGSGSTYTPKGHSTR